MVIAVSLLAAACGGSDLVLPGSSEPTAIRVVDGDDQSGPVGQLLPTPVVVEVTDPRGQQVEGITVEFVLTSAGAGAEIVPPSATTNAKGRAQARVLLGNTLGLQVGEARVATGRGTPKATFKAMVVATGPGNNGPRASFNWHCESLACQFLDASIEGGASLTRWAWSFGDGATSTQRQPAHTYAAAGTYMVTLSVTDNGGSSSESSGSVTVTSPPPTQSNKPPQAEFGVSCPNLTCTFTDRSTDADGSVVSWHWDFGDQTTSNERNPSHAYRNQGSYTVVLTVRDNDAASSTRTHQADPSAPSQPPPPPPANKAPRAEFGVSCRDLTCSFTDQSRDDDGSIVSWGWDFNDGTTSSEQNPSHSYGAAGQYQVTLRVTDNDGASASKTHQADASAPPPPPPNKPPHADFDVHCKQLNCDFSDKSTDDDGTIVSWNWSFGDGASSTERNPTHTYGDRGHYDVTLTVTDNDGATNTKTRTADVKE